MALFDSEASADVPAPEAGPSRRQMPAWSLLYSAVLALGLGLFFQVRNATVAIACRQEGGPSFSCSIERRALLGTLSIGTEHVTGVRRARTIGRAGYRNRPENAAFAVVLDTAEGERDAGRSEMGESAYAFTNAINHHIDTGAARFEETLPFDVFDGMVRLFGLLLILLGAGMAVFAVVRWRQSAHAPVE